jgi:hypothetical protein
MSKFYRNWPVHNLVGHPLAQIAAWVAGDKGWRLFHDGTLPARPVQRSQATYKKGRPE